MVDYDFVITQDRLPEVIQNLETLRDSGEIKNVVGKELHTWIIAMFDTQGVIPSLPRADDEGNVVEGTPAWKGLSQMTICLKGGDRTILVDKGHLKNAIKFKIEGEDVLVGIFGGEPSKYGLIHEFGGRITITDKMIRFFKFKAYFDNENGCWRPLSKAKIQQGYIEMPERSYLRKGTDLAMDSVMNFILELFDRAIGEV